MAAKKKIEVIENHVETFIQDVMNKLTNAKLTQGQKLASAVEMGIQAGISLAEFKRVWIDCKGLWDSYEHFSNLGSSANDPELYKNYRVMKATLPLLDTKSDAYELAHRQFETLLKKVEKAGLPL